MSEFKNSTLRSHALDIQAQTGVKYTEAMRQASRDIHVRDNSAEDYSDPAAWVEDPEYYKMLTTFDTLAVELLDVLPKLHHIDVGGKLYPWLLTREEDDSIHINPRTDVCGCFDVALLDGEKTFSPLFRVGSEVSPRLYKAAENFSRTAYEAQWQMVSLKSATHVKFYFESNWDDRDYIFDLTGLSLAEKKSALIELFNVTLRYVITDHIYRCVGETKQNSKTYFAETEKTGLAAIEYKD